MSYVEHRSGGGYIHVRVDPAGLAQITSLAQLAGPAVMKAQRRAINKALKWLAVHVARSVSQQERIAVAAVRQRLRCYGASQAAMRGKLWFGLNPIEASRIGRPKQSRRGVSVAGRRFAGAFFKTVYGSRPDVWIRTASKHFDPSLYPVESTGRPFSGAESHGRFPLAKIKVQIDGARKHFESWARKANERLLELLRQEMNYELQKVLGRAR